MRTLLRGRYRLTPSPPGSDCVHGVRQQSSPCFFSNVVTEPPGTGHWEAGPSPTAPRGPLCFELYSPASYLNTPQPLSFWVLSFPLTFQSSFILGKLSPIRSQTFFKNSLFYSRFEGYQWTTCWKPISCGPCPLCSGCSVPWSFSSVLCVTFPGLPFLLLISRSSWYSVLRTWPSPHVPSHLCSTSLLSLLWTYHLIFLLVS